MQDASSILFNFFTLINNEAKPKFSVVLHRNEVSVLCKRIL